MMDEELVGLSVVLRLKFRSVYGHQYDERYIHGNSTQPAPPKHIFLSVSISWTTYQDSFPVAKSICLSIIRNHSHGMHHYNEVYANSTGIYITTHIPVDNHKTPR